MLESHLQASAQSDLSPHELYYLFRGLHDGLDCLKFDLLNKSSDRTSASILLRVRTAVQHVTSQLEQNRSAASQFSNTEAWALNIANLQSEAAMMAERSQHGEVKSFLTDTCDSFLEALKKDQDVTGIETGNIAYTTGKSADQLYYIFRGRRSVWMGRLAELRRHFDHEEWVGDLEEVGDTVASYIIAQLERNPDAKAAFSNTLQWTQNMKSSDWVKTTLETTPIEIHFALLQALEKDHEAMEQERLG
jgi:hypothetical protein